jgi:hypothetical protein
MAHISGRGHGAQISNPLAWLGVGMSPPPSDNIVKKQINHLF